MTGQERLDFAAAVSCLVGTYDEVLAIVRRERDLAQSTARHEAGNASHWKSNHADQVARCCASGRTCRSTGCRRIESWCACRPK